MTTITQERLRELLDYNPDSGVFRWRVSLGSKVKGAMAGCPTSAGYLRVRADGRLYYLHRLAFLFVNGRMPPEHVDHINGDVADNRLSNLREVSRQTNMQNRRRARSGNAAGLIGAQFRRDTGRWHSKIRVGGTYLHLGYFDTPQQAHEAYIAAKRKHHEGNTL